ncbi:MAG TPA: hypothetical protein VE344_02555 [Methylomirabilota bacterium]|nr:hypothetical protein [Methylomirabilota bacterium]
MSRVIIVENTNAISDFEPNDAVVQQMVNRGLAHFTGKTNVSAAWRSLIATQDVVGIKVFSAGGEISGARPAVVAAIIHGLTDAGIPKNHILIWDKHEADLRAAGFIALGRQLGVRVADCAQTGYDPTNFYLPDSPVIGNLLYGDLEFGKKGNDIGRKSFVSKIVSRQITKIISVAPLLNNNDIGVCGQLFSLAIGSVDNTFRFEGDADRLSVAVPEIYALPSISDKVALNITDALLGQYEGGDKGLLHYSEVLNQLWFSRDPVALDTLAVNELKRERETRSAPQVKPNLELYTNAALLQLGVNETNKIRVEKIR